MGKIIQNGVIYTGTGSGGGGGASSVDQLTDVQLTSPTTGDELVYNSSLTSPYKWENKKLTWTGTQAQYDLIATPDPDVTYYITDASPVTANLGSLADVTINSVADENNLRYNATSGKWENKSDFIVKNSLGTTVFNVYENPSNHNGEVIVYDSNGTARNLIGNGNHYICNSSGNLVATIGTIGNYVNLDFYDSLDLSSKSISMYGDTGLIQCKGISTGSGAVTLSSKTAASGGTDLSLVTTGEKYTWGSKITGTITAWTNVTLIRGTLFKLNGVVYISAAIQLQEAKNLGALLFTLSSNCERDDTGNFDLVGVTTGGVAVPLYINNKNLVNLNISSLASGTVIIINSWFIP